MDKKEILEKTKEYIKEKFSGESTGHDWWHACRVCKLAIYIGKKEKADLFIIELAALLHDLGDWKFNKCTNKDKNPERKWLEGLQVDEKTINHVCQIIEDTSFKGASVKTPMKTKEGMIVRDADRLDGIGAIGIARTFAYGGKVGRPIYDPSAKPRPHENFEDYKKHGDSASINHFHEKLFLLKDRMNTKTAKKIANKRHKFMKHYLNEFMNEWEGKN